jgi:signal transduction histidine kinase
MRRRRQEAEYTRVCFRVALPNIVLAGLATTVSTDGAHADLASRLAIVGDLRGSHDTFLFSIFIGLILFAVTVSLLHMAGRRRWQLREGALIAALNETSARLDRAETFLSAEPQITIAWGLQSNEPDIEGDVALVSDMPILRRVLGFGSWLSPDQAQTLETAVARLRERGEAFGLSVVSLGGRHLETEGRAVSGRAVMRIRDVSGDRLEATRLREAHARTLEDVAGLRSLLDAIPCPAWTRDPLSRLTWVNTAYVRAVEAKDAQEATARGIELLESPARDAAATKRAQQEIYRGRAAAVLAGWRRTLDIVEVPREKSALGIAFDVSELEAARLDLQQTVKAHSRTLDQLSTAVAIFDRRKQLVFHNSAYRQLWSLDGSFLDQAPSESEILDRLRARRMLPEQADFRSWKEMHLSGYQSPDMSEHIWHLPDGRTLRASINPNPQSGVTYLFDDVTAQFHLESKFNAQTRVQSETLDTLKEGVAVFGTDGRLKLSNAAFGTLWRLQPAELDGKPHIDRVAALCGRLAPDAEPWNELRMAVAGLHDQRTGIEQRLTCRDGSIIECTAAPLPDGATLLTFTDTTASVNVERALTERNQALLETEQLRNDFVHHVSYELRSPLTNIIGFIQLLGDGSIGSLNPKQSEYVGYVMKSSAALLAIINDILDLATIDTGALELSLKDVDVLETIRAAAEGIQDRLAESSLNLQIVALPNIGSFRADAKRLRQILFNLLSNAIGFSAPGQTVTLAAMRRADEIVVKVSDQGRGIPHEVITHVFDRFHSNTIGSRHRGVGLGLSIVKSFVELHGGRVLIDSAPGQGTTVTCIFPTQDVKLVSAEEAQENM